MVVRDASRAAAEGVMARSNFQVRLPSTTGLSHMRPRSSRYTPFPTLSLCIFLTCALFFALQPREFLLPFRVVERALPFDPIPQDFDEHPPKRLGSGSPTPTSDIRIPEGKSTAVEPNSGQLLSRVWLIWHIF